MVKQIYDDFGDIITQLKSIEDESIQAIVSVLPLVERCFSLSWEVSYEKVSHSLLNFSNVLDECKRVLKKDGTIWLFVDNFNLDGEIIPLPFLVAEKAQEVGFSLRNIIIWYNDNAPCFPGPFLNRCSYILFLSKSKDYKFDKDPVREPHIWKEVEWGGGRRSRYHPKGKDPSNFWLKTESHKGRILRHVLLSVEEVVKRCILVSTSSGDKILDLFAENSCITKVVREEGRIPVFCYSKIDYPRKLFSSIYEKDWSERKSPLNISKKFEKVYFKSCEEMSEIPDACVQLIITSPPYWGLRDYNVPGQIGFGESYATYLLRLQKVMKECYRILRQEGSMWININKRIIQGNMILFPKDIIKIAREVGFILKDIVIWHKPIFVPTTGPRNFTDRHEYVLFFTKIKQGYFFNPAFLKTSDYVYEGAKGPENVWKIFRKIGNIGKDIEVLINGKKIKHTAVFPEELVKRIILLCSERGDIVLDPFAGSGTTIVVAEALGRIGVGYELNRDYGLIIKRRLENTTAKLLPWLHSNV
jgi:site-specific DNA-methyltransferase (adenine-specific)